MINIKETARKILLLPVVVIFITNIFLSANVEAKVYEGIRFKNYTIEEGLPQASVETMIQDDKGYIWFGTNDGLARYNGYGFKVYRNEIGVENSIIGNYIVNLNIDKDNNLWAATTDGLSRINLDTYEIRNYDEDDGFISVNITYVLVTKDNRILVGTSDGLFIYNSETDTFTRIDYEYEDEEVKIYSLGEDSLGFIWIGSTGGLRKIKINSKYECISYENFSALDDGIYDIYCDDEDVYAGTMESGLYIINSENTDEYFVVNMDNSQIPSNAVQKVFKDSRGIVWSGTENGLAKYNLKDRTSYTYTKQDYDRHSLVDDEVYSIIEDKSGLMWVGTYSGVGCFDSENRMRHYKVNPQKKDSITDNMIHGIYEDENGLIYLGTNQKGINILNEENNSVSIIDKDTEGMNLLSNSISDICGYGNYIFAATNEGLNVIDTVNKTIEAYDDKDGLKTKKLKSLYVDSRGCLWIGTSYGLYTMNIENRKISNMSYLLDENKVTDKYIECIYEDRDGIIWIGSFLGGGLTKFDRETNTVKHYTSIKGEDGISNGSVRTIIQDEEGYLWIGTSGGLNRFDIQNEEFENYTTLDGLPNNTIYGILLDSDDDLWMSTNLGISYFDKSEKRFSNLNVNDGLQSNEFNGASYFKCKDGRMMFAGINGLNVFNPEDVISDSYISSVKFDEIKLNGDELDGVESIDNRKLTSEENTISVKVFVDDYKNLENIKYYYCLAGDSDEWIPMDTNEITLSNLCPGKYKFKVKARNSNGIFSDENSFSFEVLPVFWKSPIAISLYVFCSAIFVGIVMYVKNERMYRLNIMVEERTKELNEEMDKNNKLFNRVLTLEKNKNSYLVNISHELRTPLNVLSSIEQVIRELNKSDEGIGRERINHYMDISKANVARLLKLINDIVDSSKIEHGNYHIKIEKNDIVYIVEETVLSLKDYVESKDIELIIDPEVEECIIDCDKNEIERCIVNLVNNAAKFTEPGGKILVSIEELDDVVKINVSDTGIGIDEKYLETIFNRFNQVVDESGNDKKGSGLGLTITRLIVNLHKGHISVTSKVNEGSTFIITLPKCINE
ncbi:MAG: two-component regulator propeller domain-containing protein [Clostridium sp.]|nr:two-component regulator propeller domain-containing protein [Clostridium sp.]